MEFRVVHECMQLMHTISEHGFTELILQALLCIAMLDDMVC